MQLSEEEKSYIEKGDSTVAMVDQVMKENAALEKQVEALEGLKKGLEAKVKAQ